MGGSTIYNTLQFISEIVNSLPIWFWIALIAMCIAGMIVAFIKGLFKVAIILAVILVVNLVAGGRSAVLLKYASSYSNQAASSIAKQVQEARMK